MAYICDADHDAIAVPALPRAGRVGCPPTDRATASLRLQLAQNLLRSLGGAADAERARTR